MQKWPCEAGGLGRASHFSKVTPRGRSHTGYIDGAHKSGVGFGEKTFFRGRVRLYSPALSGGLGRKLSVVVLLLPPSLSPLGTPKLRTECTHCLSPQPLGDRMPQVCTDLRAKGWRLTGSLGDSNEGIKLC